MNTPRLRTVALAAAAITILSFSATQANAGTYVSVHVGTPPPPPPRVVYQQWPQPSRNAVWIAGHNEWQGGRWVYVGGYYAYPPHRGAAYYPARYHHGYYYPGYWR